MGTRVSRARVWLPAALAVLLVTTGIATLALGPAADAPGKIAALDPRGVRPPNDKLIIIVKNNIFLINILF